MSRRAGQEAEHLACQHLQAAGLKLVERNFHTRLGEIDLIMRQGDTLVFIEVRSRRSSRYGGAAASVDARKQLRLRRTAEQYLQRLRRVPPCRFDVVTLEGDRIDWITDAF